MGFYLPFRAGNVALRLGSGRKTSLKIMFTRPDPVVDNKINEFNAGHPPYKSHFY